MPMIVNKCLGAVNKPVDLIFNTWIEFVSTTTNLAHDARHSANISDLPVGNYI
jgi:hypothetical protein